MNSIISFLITYNQFLISQIYQLLVFIAKNIPLKSPKYDITSPKYNKLTVDNGIIQISTKIRNGNLIIEVTDNGSGIDADTLKSITEDANFKKKFSGIGVQNINERIKLYFGKNYGLCFSSELNEGTKVTLTLPVIFCTKEEEYCKTD